MAAQKKQHFSQDGATLELMNVMCLNMPNHYLACYITKNNLKHLS